MTKVWIYARRRVDPSHLEQQLRSLRQYAGENDMVVMGESYDLTDTAMNKRPGLKMLMQQMEEGQVQTVLVTRLSSISHNNHRLMRFLKKLQKYHVKLRTTQTQTSYEMHQHRLDRHLRNRAHRFEGFIPW